MTTFYLDTMEKKDELERSHPSIKETLARQIAIKETLKSNIRSLDPPGGEYSASWEDLKNMLCTLIDYMELNV